MTFRILESQMQALAAQTREQFVAMMNQYLREHFGEWVSGFFAGSAGERGSVEAALSSWLEQALTKSAKYGVTSEPEAAQFILLLTVLGLDADERHDWVRDVVQDPDLAAVGKVKKLVAMGRQRHLQIEQVLVYDGLED